MDLAGECKHTSVSERVEVEEGVLLLWLAPLMAWELCWYVACALMRTIWAQHGQGCCMQCMGIQGALQMRPMQQRGCCVSQHALSWSCSVNIAHFYSRQVCPQPPLVPIYWPACRTRAVPRHGCRSHAGLVQALWSDQPWKQCSLLCVKLSAVPMLISYRYMLWMQSQPKTRDLMGAMLQIPAVVQLAVVMLTSRAAR